MWGNKVVGLLGGMDIWGMIIHGDCLGAMAGMEANSIDAIVTDPPYGLSFMGKNWDHGIPGVPFWAEALRVAKPGCHLLAFGGTRTFHRLACAIEDAGWEIRDTLMWVYGSGFPKSHDVSKAIDKAAGAERTVIAANKHAERYPNGPGGVGFHGGPGEYSQIGRPPEPLTAPATDAARQWEGWGTALKPAWEPIIMARKPIEDTVAANVQKWGCGSINIDGCRVGIDKADNIYAKNPHTLGTIGAKGIYGAGKPTMFDTTKGRWPANLLTDGSEEVLELFPNSKAGVAVRHRSGGNTFGGDNPKPPMDDMAYGDSGSAARFFYCAKASRAERTCGGAIVNGHPTIKPLALMRYLVRLVTPPGGTVLDPFMGSGTTGMAAKQGGFEFIGIEKEAEYVEIAERRIWSIR